MEIQSVTYRVRKFSPQKQKEWRSRVLKELESNDWTLHSMRVTKFAKTGNHYVTLKFKA